MRVVLGSERTVCSDGWCPVLPLSYLKYLEFTGAVPELILVSPDLALLLGCILLCRRSPAPAASITRRGPYPHWPSPAAFAPPAGRAGWLGGGWAPPGGAHRACLRLCVCFPFTFHLPEFLLIAQDNSAIPSLFLSLSPLRKSPAGNRVVAQAFCCYSCRMGRVERAMTLSCHLRQSGARGELCPHPPQLSAKCHRGAQRCGEVLP